jgi:hypothetical protein
MASLVAPVTNQHPWRPFNAPSGVFNTTGALSNPEAFAHTDTLWDPTTGSQAMISALPEHNSLSLKFYGKPPTSGDPITGQAALWGIARFTQNDTTFQYQGDVLGRFELTLRTAAVVTGILPSGMKFIKNINPVDDDSLFPGIRLVGQRGNAPASIVLDGTGYWGYMLEMTNVKVGTSGEATEELGAVYRLL